jgi:pyruvate kinase
MYRGVYPIKVDFSKLGPYKVTESVVELMKDKGIISSGDSIVVTRGDMLGDQGGGTNTMKIVQVQ